MNYTNILTGNLIDPAPLQVFQGSTPTLVSTAVRYPSTFDRTLIGRFGFVRHTEQVADNVNQFWVVATVALIYPVQEVRFQTRNVLSRVEVLPDLTFGSAFSDLTEVWRNLST